MTQTKRHILPKISGPAKTFFGPKKWSGHGRTGHGQTGRTADEDLVLTVEALSEGGMRGGTCSFVPWKKLACSPVPKNRKLAFLCSLFPNIVFVLLKIGLCSP